MPDRVHTKIWTIMEGATEYSAEGQVTRFPGEMGLKESKGGQNPRGKAKIESQGRGIKNPRGNKKSRGIKIIQPRGE